MESILAERHRCPKKSFSGAPQKTDEQQMVHWVLKGIPALDNPFYPGARAGIVRIKQR